MKKKYNNVILLIALGLIAIITSGHFKLNIVL